MVPASSDDVFRLGLGGAGPVERAGRRIEGAPFQDRPAEAGVLFLDRELERARRLVRSLLHEQQHHLRRVVIERPVEGSGPVEGVLHVRVGALLQQQGHDVEACLVGGEEEGGGAVARLGVHVGPFREQAADRGHVTAPGRVPQIFVARSRGEREGGAEEGEHREHGIQTHGASRRGKVPY